MAHGVTNQLTDSFTANNTGQTFVLPVATDPDFPIRAEVISVATTTGIFSGSSALSWDVQLKDGTYIDSGQPAQSIVGASGSVFRANVILSTASVKGFRTRISGFAGGTSVSVVSTVVYLL
jgi:hypothetical protein